MEPITFQAFCFDAKEREIETKNATDTQDGEEDQYCSVILGSRSYDANHIKISPFNNTIKDESEILGIYLNRDNNLVLKEERVEMRGNFMFVTYRYSSEDKL